MRMLRHFERLVMMQVVVAIAAFCVADQNLPLLVAAMAVVLGAWLLRRSWPEMGLPRWAVNLASLAAVGWLVVELKGDAPQLVTAAGRFVISLQVIVLWGPRGNREYGQLMALSLLLMIAAAVLTVQLAFGVLLLAYCLVALVAVFMLEIKSTGDVVVARQKKAAPRPAAFEAGGAVTGRSPGAHLRSTAVLVGLICAVVAGSVFLVLPRAESRMIDLDLRRLTRRPGFTNQVQFGAGSLLNDDPTPVMSVSLTLDGARLGESAAPILLRGAALDLYSPRQQRWSRSPAVAQLDRRVSLSQGRFLAGRTAEPFSEIEARITLKGVGDGHLFTVMPPTHVAGETLDHLEYNPLDHTFSAGSGAAGAMMYRTAWPAAGFAAYEPIPFQSPFGNPPSTPELMTEIDYAAGWRVQPDRVARLAADVLAEQGLEPPDAGDAPPRRLVRAAAALANHLRRDYRYALDAPPPPPDGDPVAEFLFVTKAGHCEAFASGFAALARSLGLRTRVITGYRVSEYNPVAGEFIVRRRHAHAWNEVYLGPGHGWHTVDATPPVEIERIHEAGGAWWAPLRSLYEFVEFRWIRSVVAYDRRTRDAVVASTLDRLQQAAVGRDSLAAEAWHFVANFPRNWRLNRFGYTALVLVALALVIAVALLVRNVIKRRERVRSLHLRELPRRHRRVMARRLKFYLLLVEALERHGYARPEWQSPRAFAEQLAARDPERFEPVLSLTQTFYEIRFGRRGVDPDLAQRIRHELSRLEPALSSRSTRDATPAAA